MAMARREVYLMCEPTPNHKKPVPTVVTFLCHQIYNLPHLIIIISNYLKNVIDYLILNGVGTNTTPPFTRFGTIF